MKKVNYKGFIITAYTHIPYPPFPNYIAVARKEIKNKKKCPINGLTDKILPRIIAFSVEANSLNEVIALAKDEIDFQKTIKWSELL